MKRKANNSQNESIQGSASIYGSFIAQESTRNLADATTRVFHDSREMERLINQYKNCGLDFRQGRAFEFLEVLKFNRSAAEQGHSELRAQATHFLDPHSPKDIIITKHGDEIFGVQAKSRDTIVNAIRDHSKEKYHGLGRLNPSDQYERIKALLEKRLDNAPEGQIYKHDYEDVQKNLMKSLKYDGIGSTGTSRTEAEFASEHPEIMRFLQNGNAILTEVGTAALHGAKSSAAFAVIAKGFISASNVINGDKDLAAAISETMSMTASAAVRGSIVAGTSKAIGIAAKSAGLKSLSEGAAPITVANTMYSMAKAINLYMKGRIDKETLKEECGEASIRGVATYYCGVVGQVLIPIPVLGALVGSLVGYTTSALLVQSGILGVGKKNIVFVARKKRQYIEEQCLKAVELMGIYRSMFEHIGSVYANQYTEKILPSLSIIDDALIRGDAELAISGLAFLNENFSKKLQFRTFAEFNDFMLDKKTVLTL